MKVEETTIPDLVLLTAARIRDSRGWFSETWRQDTLARRGSPLHWAQDNHSYSVQAGTLRGLHYQAPPRAQDKLVRCTRGSIRDVAVDFRTGSPTFGRWVAVELSAENGRQLLIPKGFLHGFVTLEDHTEVQYKCSDVYSPEHDAAVRWNDPDLAIDWGVATPILSDKDRAAPLFAQAPRPFVHGGAA